MPARVYNWLRRARRPLDPEALLLRACRLTRLADWGDDRAFLQGLRALTEAINEWPAITPWGQRALEGQIVKALAVRLQLRERMRTEPEVFVRPVERPLFIVGLARTGTTFLQRLLAQDPGARTTRYWEALAPIPAPAPDTYDRDRRIVAARIELTVTRYFNPRLQAVHPMAATWPDEDLPVLLRAFGFPWSALVANPSLSDWLTRNRRGYLPAVYRHHRAEIQHLQSRVQGGHWLLKSPYHAWGLSALLEAYPDAQIVQTHRDPRRVVPSACSLWYAIRAGLEARIEVSGMGEEVLARWEPLLADLLAFRRTGPGAAQVYDVHYARLMADPLGTARAIYEHFDRRWDGALESRMAAFVAEERRARRPGQHRYSAEQFGLTPARIDEAFVAYRRLFGVDRE